VRWAIAVLAGAVTAMEPLAVALPDGALVAVPGHGAEITVAGRTAATRDGWAVLSITGPATAAAIHRSGRPAGQVRLPALRRDPAHLAVIGRWNWPDAAAMARIEASVGGALDAVAVVSDPGARAGLGGWEARIPLLPLAAHAGGPLGEAARSWNGVVAWGPFGFPLADQPIQIPDRALRSAGRWRIPVLPATPWDPASRSPRQEPAVLRLTVIAAQAAGAHLLLAPGDGCGLLSHPLGDLVERDRPPRLGPVPNGIRYLLADAGGDHPDHLDPLAAETWASPLVPVLSASGPRLALRVVDPSDGRIAWTLDWQADPDGAVAGTGPGSGQPDALARVWRAGGDGASAAFTALAWAARIDLERINPSYQETAAWLADPSPEARRMAGRLAEQPDDLLRGRIRVDLAIAPAWLRRDAVLRSLDSADHGLIDRWADFAARIEDDALDDALLRRIADDRIHALVLRRFEAMADGRLALPADPVRQHRLVAAVGDDPRTGFRAHRALRLLRERLAPLARGPAERYLARTGE
jgi:hypothetical protein